MRTERKNKMTNRDAALDGWLVGWLAWLVTEKRESQKWNEKNWIWRGKWRGVVIIKPQVSHPALKNKQKNTENHPFFVEWVRTGYSRLKWITIRHNSEWVIVALSYEGKNQTCFHPKVKDDSYAIWPPNQFDILMTGGSSGKGRTSRSMDQSLH